MQRVLTCYRGNRRSLEVSLDARQLCNNGETLRRAPSDQAVSFPYEVITGLSHGGRLLANRARVKNVFEGVEVLILLHQFEIDEPLGSGDRFGAAEPGCRRLEPRATLRATRPFSWASASSIPRLVLILRASEGDKRSPLPSVPAISLFRNDCTIGALSRDNLICPRFGMM